MKPNSAWQHKTLEELETQDWRKPSDAPTNLVKRCIELSKIPVNTFSLSDLRLMIGQGFGLSYLIPLALGKLKENIFIEADFYEGDLLSNVLNIDPEFWSENRNYWAQLNRLISDKSAELIARNISTRKFYE